jgi:hypothetical protein
VESLLSKATAMKNDEGQSPGICFLKWTHPMSEHSEDNPSLRRFKRVFKTKKPLPRSGMAFEPELPPKGISEANPS